MGQCCAHSMKRCLSERPTNGPRSRPVRRIGSGLLNGEIDEERTEQSERGEEIEIGGNAEMVGDGGRD